MACIESATFLYEEFGKYLQRKGRKPNEIAFMTGILAGDKYLTAYMFVGPCTSIKDSMAEIVHGHAKPGDSPFIFQRFPICPECEKTVQARRHIEEGHYHLENRPFSPPPPKCSD